MYFIEFPVSATNIFPLANSEAGGQLLSEFNLRSRESVATDPTVEYIIGPSYTHSMDDFSLVSSSNGAALEATVIQIQPGRAIVNGHYVELKSPITMDIAAINLKASQEGVQELKGDLAIGLVMQYSTIATLAASAKPENADGYYEGVQVVIVPETAMRRPIDVPTEAQRSEVNMHLLLGTFSYAGGRVSNVHDSKDKVKMLDASRVGDLSTSLSEMYVTKSGMDPHHLYVFADKRNSTSDPQLDTWCVADDSLMKWDVIPQMTKNPPDSGLSSIAHFQYDTFDQKTKFIVPHKQIDGAVDQQGNPIYFADKVYDLPVATYDTNTGGVVDPKYTSRILQIGEKVDRFYRLPNGKMREYIAVLSDRANLPKIPIADDSIQPIDVEGLFNSILTGLQTQIDNLYSADSEDSSDSDSEDTALNKKLAAISSVIEDITNRLDLHDGETQMILDLIDNVEREIRLVAGPDSSCTLEEAKTAINNAQYQGAISAIELAQDSLLGNGGAISKLNDVRDAIANMIEHHAIPDLNSCMTELSRCIADLYDSVYESSTSLDNIKSSVEKLQGAVEGYIDDEIERRWETITTQTTSCWSPGDYVLVGNDQTVSSVDGVYPSTMYVVNYGKILEISYVGSLQEDVDISDPEKIVENREIVYHKVPKALAGGVELQGVSISDPTTLKPSLFDYTTYYGCIGKDYFVARYVETDSENNVEHWTSYFYTPSVTETQLTYIPNPIMITGGVGRATTTTLGGFLDVEDNAVGQGYVSLDEDGHLRVVDFNLLLMGIEAQQLGEDIAEIGSGMDLAAIQTDLDQYVNGRICYPNSNQFENCWDKDEQKYIKDPHVIEITITLPETTESGSITIEDVGSRAGSSLYVHILGSATSATTVIFKNCEKLRVDETIGGNPTLAFDNVNLYYNANVLDRAAYNESISVTGIRNLKLWYEQDYDDATSPNLQVNDMTVTLLGNIAGEDTIDPWDTQNPNDNHYSYALRSITFASDGSIINFGLIVGDSSTMNVDVTGHSLFRASFTLPQSSGLAYPATKMLHQLKVSGSFTSCYYDNSLNKYVVKDTNFSAITQKYQLTSPTIDGSIAFCTDSYYVSHITGVADTETVDVWNLNTPHLFFGGAIE